MDSVCDDAVRTPARPRKGNAPTYQHLTNHDSLRDSVEQLKYGPAGMWKGHMEFRPPGQAIKDLIARGKSPFRLVVS